MTGPTGRPAETIAHDVAVAADRTRLLGPDDPETICVRSDLAEAFGESGQLLEAIGQLRDLVAEYIRGLGPDHADIGGDDHEAGSL